MIVKQRKPYFLTIKTKELLLHKDVQMRCSLNRIAIVDYAEAMGRGEKFPPPVVFWIPGSPKIVADGFHRVLAARRNGVKEMKVEIRTGTKRDAMLYAAGCNTKHGVRRTPEDKRKAVLSFLGDREWKNWSDTTIARCAGVGPTMVGQYRKWLGAKGDVGENGQQQRKFVDRNGVEHTTSVSEHNTELENIGKGSICPYCKQKMPSGHSPGPRGYASHAKRLKG